MCMRLKHLDKGTIHLAFLLYFWSKYTKDTVLILRLSCSKSAHYSIDVYVLNNNVNNKTRNMWQGYRKSNISVSDSTYQKYIQLMHFDCLNNISTWYIEYTKSITYKVTRFGKSLNDSDRIAVIRLSSKWL